MPAWERAKSYWHPTRARYIFPFYYLYRSTAIEVRLPVHVSFCFVENNNFFSYKMVDYYNIVIQLSQKI